MIVKLSQSLLLGIFLLSGIGACSLTRDILPDRRPDYRTSTTANPLEVPPDLTSSTIDDVLIVPELNPQNTATLSAYTDERSDDKIALQETILRSQTGLQIERDGSRRWLVVAQPSEQLWPRIKSFWTGNGFALERSDPRTGIMETRWLENRADIPAGPIRTLLKDFFSFSSPTRDKFRVRLERSEAGTEIFLTHYGMQEIYIGRGQEVALWTPRERDPELEAEMLSRLMVHLGVEQQRAETLLTQEPAAKPVRSRLIDTADGYRALVIEESYDQAWRLVGLALDSSNFVIEDQNRAQGLYVVEQRSVQEKKQRGFIGRLLFGEDDEGTDQAGDRYQVRLAGRGPQTLVIVQNQEGAPVAMAAATQILESMREIIQ